jgi:hypothetical protein
MQSAVGDTIDSAAATAGWFLRAVEFVDRAGQGPQRDRLGPQGQLGEFSKGRLCR